MLALPLFAIPQEVADTTVSDSKPKFMYDLGISIEPSRESVPPYDKGVANLGLVRIQDQLDSLSMAFSSYKEKVGKRLLNHSRVSDSLVQQIEILQNRIFMSPYASLSTPIQTYSKKEGGKFYQKGNDAYIHQNYEVAIDYFSKAISSRLPSSKIGDIYYLIGNCYIQLDDDLLAIEYLKKVAEHPLSEKSDDALFLTAVTYQKMNNIKMATIFLKRIIKKYPDNKLARIASLELNKLKHSE